MRRLLWLCLAVACPAPPPAETDGLDSEEPEPEPVWVWRREVRVTLDGQAADGVVITQGGALRSFVTDADGRATVDLDPSITGDVALHASHPAARIAVVVLAPGDSSEVVFDLRSLSLRDNEAYTFQDPGTPERSDTTAQCGHCHGRLMRGWFTSAHAGSASNPTVHDLYAGTVQAADAEVCEALGGTWAEGRAPGTGAPIQRCYRGANVLAALDPACAPNCDGKTRVTAGCADCHAPGLDGPLGGRDLLDATGFAFEHGVHCDVCHKVERVLRDDPRPGVSGSLVIVRPETPQPGPLGPWEPLMFGPRHDNANPRMGNVQRDHFTNGDLCLGCHEYATEPLLPGAEIDRARWPDGRLPVHTTWSEWRDGPFGGKVACPACHMPPEPQALNSADLEHLGDSRRGVPTGWDRPPGAVRSHQFLGPKSEGAELLRLAAGLDVRVVRDGATLTATVTVTNVAAGHRIPTGEPGRLITLRVGARCGASPLAVVAGDVVPPWVGARSVRSSDEDLSRWPEVRPRDRVVAVRRDGWREDDGWGPFGRGAAETRGLPRWVFVGEATARSVDDGIVTWDRELPPADRYILGASLEVSSSGPGLDAGSAGHAFARVLVGPDGRALVPHPWAVDVTSDNRLAPGQSATSTHVFAATCADPEVSAVLVWRPHPPWLAEEKLWDNAGIVMAAHP